MGNYYRSRLAEELALHYAVLSGLKVEVDSGGLSRIPNPNHPGNIARGTLQYLKDINVEPQQATREPKNCNNEDVYSSDIVILTDIEEQRDLFWNQFPDFKGELIGWDARDIAYDSMLNTLEKIDRNVQQLIKELVTKNNNI